MTQRYICCHKIHSWHQLNHLQCNNPFLDTIAMKCFNILFNDAYESIAIASYFLIVILTKNNALFSWTRCPQALWKRPQASCRRPRSPRSVFSSDAFAESFARAVPRARTVPRALGALYRHTHASCATQFFQQYAVCWTDSNSFAHRVYYDSSCCQHRHGKLIEQV
jgi:hypothetical protein